MTAAADAGPAGEFGQVLARLPAWSLVRPAGEKACRWVRTQPWPPETANPPGPNAVRVPGLAIPFTPESERP